MGLLPSIMHGASCTGLNEGELSRALALACKVVEPRPQGESTTSCLVFGGSVELGPIFGATVTPVCALARAVWEGWAPVSALQATFDGCAEQVTRWDQSRGPLAAAALSFKRIGYDV